MIGKMSNVAVVGPEQLHISWDDGRSYAVDLSDMIAKLPVLKPLRGKREFSRVQISEDGWSLEWPCGIDFGAPQLRRWAEEQAGEIMRAEAFRAWMAQHTLTLDQAADALGLSRRMIAYYLSGEKVIPKTVMLATEGYAARVLT